MFWCHYNERWAHVTLHLPLVDKAYTETSDASVFAQQLVKLLELDNEYEPFLMFAEISTPLTKVCPRKYSHYVLCPDYYCTACILRTCKATLQGLVQQLSNCEQSTDTFQMGYKRKAGQLLQGLNLLCGVLLTAS